MELSSSSMQYFLNTIVFISAGVFFYWFRYGGTLNHRKKPEWDEVPTIVKNDIFLSKATIDDLIAFELAWKREVCEALKHDDAESLAIMKPILTRDWSSDTTPLALFRRTAKGAKIQKPKHIFSCWARVMGNRLLMHRSIICILWMQVCGSGKSRMLLS